jgi:long-chain acyl-CoA synthetase
MDRIWLKSYPPGVPADISIDHIPSLVALFEDACSKYAKQVAYVSMGKEMTYAELDEETRAFAGWLQSRGLKKGDRVALMMPNLLQYPVALFGTLRAGGVVVNSRRGPPRELAPVEGFRAETIVIVHNLPIRWNR